VVVEVIVNLPEQKYILAIDDSKSTLIDIIRCISETLSNGMVRKLSKEDAFAEKSITQSDYDLLMVNLRLDAGFIKEAGIELKYEVYKFLILGRAY
jgi:adenylate kinase